MVDTAFSIELQGLMLPDDVKSRLQSELQSVVMAEIAKTDIGKGATVEPLPAPAERGARLTNPIMGFVIRGAAGAERDVVQVASVAYPVSLELGLRAALPLDGASPEVALGALYYRPDIRAAITSNTRAFAELLSHDEQATKILNQLSTGGDERVAPLILLGWVGCAAEV